MHIRRAVLALAALLIGAGSADSECASRHLAEDMSAVQARGIAAIVGGVVADAAAMPLHWIYDVVRRVDDNCLDQWDYYSLFAVQAEGIDWKRQPRLLQPHLCAFLPAHTGLPDERMLP